MGIFSYTSRAGFTFLLGVSLTHPLLALVFCWDFLLGHVEPDDVVIADIAGQTLDIFLHGPESAQEWHSEDIHSHIHSNPATHTSKNKTKQKTKLKLKPQLTNHDAFA